MANREEILKSFLETWPLSRLETMKLSEYTNLNKSDSFCYWLEAATYHLGSIWGGSAFKFGIYEKNNKASSFISSGRLSDADYAWSKKYGETRESAFQKVKDLIVQIAYAAMDVNITAIDQIDMGDAVKWKIAYLYSDNQILNIFNKEKLQKIAKILEIEIGDKMSFSQLQKAILDNKPSTEDYFEYGARIWDLDKQDVQKKYWIYSPGEQAYKWEEFFKDKIMALGWDDLGNLVNYKSKAEIQKKLIEVYESDTNRNNDAIANYDFANSINIGDVIIVKKGRQQLLGYGVVESAYYFDEDKEDFKHCRKVDWKCKGNWQTDHTLVMKTLTDITSYNSEIIKDKKYFQHLLDIISGKYSQEEITNNSFVELLNYKKQIILQGPPGTGKTRLAKEIALEMIGNNNEINFNNYLQKGISISNASGAEDYYLLEKVTANSVELSSERATKKWSASFNKISEKISQLKNGEAVKNKGGDDPYVLAVAKYIFKKLENNSKLLEDNEQFKLIQFHPSYTYEDFVRGIVAKPNEEGNGIIYDAENKTLGKFAKKALDNFLASKGIVQNDNFESRLQILIDEVNTKVVNGDIYSFGDKSSAEIFAVGNDYFYYSFPKRKEIRYKLLFSDLEKIFQKKSEISIPIDLRDKEKDFQLIMKGKYPYYFMLLRKLESYKIAAKSEDNEEIKKYILIIDEINRANLSSVLGELIYALEYRGEEVESMYEVDGSQKLILPPNLYIIGTMNTADRSVGHIDYAIRRRFAFVDVLPKELDDDKIVFHKDWFKKISELFIDNFDEYLSDERISLKRAKTVSGEFRPEDVWIGHSYFIQKKVESGILEPEDFRMRIDYEIKPILLEYVKDGVLTGKVGEMTVEEYVKSL